MAQRKPIGAVLARLSLLTSVIVQVVALLAIPVIVGVRFHDRMGTLAWRVTVISTLAFVAAILFRRLLPSQPRRIVLDLDLTKDIPEESDDSPIATIRGKGQLTIRDVVQGLDRAAKDKRVVAIVARVGDPVLGPGKVAEIRDAVLAFRESGKRAVVFSETMGEGGGGTGVYYLSTAFSEIVLQPSGDVGLVGLHSVTPFLKGTLDKAGLEPRFDHRHEYKSYKNMFTETEFTPAHRESTEAILDSIFDHVTAGIAEARGLDQASVKSLVDRGPFDAATARAEGLVDRLAYRDELLDELLGDKKRKPAVIAFAKWWKRARKRERGASVAVVYGVGAITRGKNRYEPPMGKVMGSDTVASALRAARTDKKVKAIVFRVDSPGGSAVASDTVWREVVRAKADGKPVIVSMGDVAGSGGYWISMHADKIVAQPTTVTGSIGVVTGKFVAAGLREKVGLSVGTIARGEHAGMYSSVGDFTPSQWQKIQDDLDRIYDEFITKVSDGRGMTKEAVHEVAKGRVWTGVDAKARGLVDELGGFPVALRLAREAADLKPDAPVKLKVFPKKKGPLGFLNRGEDPADELFAIPPAIKELYELAGAAMPAGVASVPPGFTKLLRF